MWGSIPIAHLVMSAVAHWQNVSMMWLCSLSPCVIRIMHDIITMMLNASWVYPVIAIIWGLSFNLLEHLLCAFLIPFSFSVKLLISLEHNDSTLPLSIHSILSTYNYYLSISGSLPLYFWKIQNIFQSHRSPPTYHIFSSFPSYNFSFKSPLNSLSDKTLTVPSSDGYRCRRPFSFPWSIIQWWPRARHYHLYYICTSTTSRYVN